MGIFSDFSEFGAAVGTEIGTNEWGEITQDRINRFADATCDEQWIHIARDRAKNELPGGKTITHGLFSLSLAPMFIRSRPAARMRGRADRTSLPLRSASKPSLQAIWRHIRARRSPAAHERRR
jgi:acyl dehydratase